MRLLLQLLFSVAMFSNLSSQDYIDKDYGIDGTASVNLPESILGEAEYMSVDSLENVYILASVNKPVLIKLLPDGTLDKTFGEEGFFFKSNFSTYQKDNYLISIQIVGQSSVVNIYDLELNFIQGYRLPQVTDINSLSYRNDYLIGSTKDGSLFKYETEAQLDTSFRDRGLINLFESHNILGTYIGSLNDSLHIIKGYMEALPYTYISKILYLNNQGQVESEFLIDTVVINTSIISQFNLNLSHDKKFIINYDLYSFSNTPDESRYIKLNSAGQIDTTFGQSGFMNPVVNNDFKTKLLGELSSRNFPVHDLIGTITNPKLHMLTQSGQLNAEFGEGGLYDLTQLPGDQISILAQSPNNDFVYVSTSLSFSPSLIFLTKLDLSSVPKTEDFISQNKNLNTNYDLLIFPNPSSGIIKIKYSGPSLTDIDCKIYNLSGELVKTLHLDRLNQNMTYKINLDLIQSGIYTLSLMSENKILNHQQFQLIK